MNVNVDIPSSKSSYTSFNEVDESVAKPVLGSDAAARWQDFRQSSKVPIKSSNVAPSLPLKHLDRVLGTKSIQEERAREANVRKEAGDREIGAGYTEFKKKVDHEEVAARKRRKLILERVRPSDVPYFFPADVYEGFKFDYVFTTLDRGTGYYWDGMDSRKKELGEGTDGNGSAIINSLDESIQTTSEVKTKKKKKKTREITSAAIPDVDPFNPMEQVAAAMLRRNQALNAPFTKLFGVSTIERDAVALGATPRPSLSSPSVETILEPELVAAGWESSIDTISGKMYYFRRSTNERSWNKPDLSQNAGVETDNLPDGWKSTKDLNSGNIYYYHSSGKTSWERPLPE